MNETQKTELRQHVANLNNKQRKQLVAQAVELRDRTKERSHARAPIEFWMHRAAFGKATGEEATRGTVVALHKGRCRVLLNQEVVDAALKGELARVQQTTLAVGDHVALVSDQQGARWVAEVLPRSTSLVRPDPANAHRERVLAANVDRVVVVVAAASPPLHPRLIDRYLVAVQRGGAKASVCLNKIDLVGPEELDACRQRLRPYEDAGVPVHLVSAGTGEGIQTLSNDLAGMVSVFVGHSGVGKSSVMNALLGQAVAETSEISTWSGKGQHTTRSSSMLPMTGGGWLIDTPGVRSLGLYVKSILELAWYFPEFEQYRQGCRFRNCLHRAEPECSVREAVRTGELSRFRYDAYRRIAAEMEGDPPDDPFSPNESSGFVCAHCGTPVSGDSYGTRQRNHCPMCLHSRHLDVVPGDRSSCCGGVMDPVALWARREGEWALVHRCRDCGVLSSNRIAGDDNEAMLLSLAVRPLSSPPFPLERIGGMRT